MAPPAISVEKLRAAAAAARRTIAPHVERTLWAELGEDRLLLWSTVALWLFGLIPMAVTHFLPFADLPINTAASSLLWDAARGHLPTATYYHVNWAPVPYWTTYLISAFFERLTNPLFAAKATTAIIQLLIPLGTMRLLVTFGRSPRLALWAFLLGYEHNMYAGWHAYLFGIALSLFVIAWTIEAQTLKQAARIVPFTALIGLTHAQAVALLGVIVPVLILLDRPWRRRLAIHTVALSGCGITMLPWMLGGMHGNVGAVTLASCEWHTPAAKLAQFFAYSLDDLGRPAGERAAAIAFVVLVVGPLLLGLLPRRAAAGRALHPAVLLAGAGALYAFLPFAIPGIHWYTYPRYASVILLFLLLVPSPRLDGRWVLALLPGVVAIVIFDLAVARQFAAFEIQARPLLEIVEQVKPGGSVLPLVFDDDVPDPEMKLSPYHQMHAYVAAFRKGYEGYLWNHESVPLLYHQENRKPAPYWDVGAEMAFTMNAYGQHFDYVLVQGFQRGDPLVALAQGPSPRPRLVVQAGRWRLYEMMR
jgi:hypothetical protein